MAALEWRGRPRFTDQPHLTMDCLPALKGLVRHSITRRAEHFLFLPASSRSPSRTVTLALPGCDLDGDGGLGHGRETVIEENGARKPSFHDGRPGRLMQAPEVDRHQPSAATGATDRVKPSIATVSSPRVAVSILVTPIQLDVDIHIGQHRCSCCVMLISCCTDFNFKVADPRGLPRQPPTSLTLELWTA